MAAFPWVGASLLAGSFLLLFVLGVQPFLDGAPRVVLLGLGGVGALFFGWLTPAGVRVWALPRMLRWRIRSKA